MNPSAQAGQSRIRRRQPFMACVVGVSILFSFQRLHGSEGWTPQRFSPDATLSLASLLQFSAAAGEVESAAANQLEHSSASNSIAIPIERLNLTVPEPVPVNPFAGQFNSTNPPANLAQFMAETNALPRDQMSENELLTHLQRRLEIARYLRKERKPAEAEPILAEMLSESGPIHIQQSALLELAALAQDQNNLTRAQQIYAQFLSKWADDLRVPEILLRQGLLFRRMGLYNLALTKFYSVMTSALMLKNDQFDYYVRIVLDAQTQIAETHYELGKYAEAADFFSRLLKQNNATINKALVLYRLTRCHAAIGKYAEAVADAQDYLIRFPDAAEQAEVRFHLAVSLKQLGRDNESLQQVLFLLQEQKALTRNRPEVWAYWQQRAGNLIANQLYREGDFTKALQIYLNLSQLDTSATWQISVNYQIGITYERLWQPQKAIDTYNGILGHEKELGSSPAPGMKTILDMARWRINFIKWQGKAEAANRQLQANKTNNPVTASLPVHSTTFP